MPSFDIISQINEHEMQNAFDQAQREVSNRYDFRNTETNIQRNDVGFLITANSKDRVKAAYEVLMEKTLKRKQSLNFLEPKDINPASGKTWQMEIKLKTGINSDNAKKIVQCIKDSNGTKVLTSIKGDTVRVSAKKRDDLQITMAYLRTNGFPVEEFSYINLRD